MIYLKQAILHYYQASSLSPSYSELPLEIENEFVHTYLEKHIERARKDYSTSQGQFFKGAVTWEKCQLFQNNELSFLELSRFLAETLFSDLMYASDETSRDVIICHYMTANNENHLAYLICKNKVAYTHSLLNDDDGKSKIDLIKYSAILPSETQRLEAYALINLEKGSISLSDKSVKIDGDKVNLLADLVLGCSFFPSSKENYVFVKKTLNKICEEYAQN